MARKRRLHRDDWPPDGPPTGKRLDWVVTQQICWDITHCRKCGAAPGHLHHFHHQRWIAEVRYLEGLWLLPAPIPERYGHHVRAGLYYQGPE